MIRDEPVRLRHRVFSRRGTSCSTDSVPAPEQSSSTVVPSAGSVPANVVSIEHGTWNSRLTMPMWLRGVPLVHTMPVSSWYSGARKVAPASRTPATTPSAPVSVPAAFEPPPTPPAPESGIHHNWFAVRSPAVTYSLDSWSLPKPSSDRDRRFGPIVCPLHQGVGRNREAIANVPVTMNDLTSWGAMTTNRPSRLARSTKGKMCGDDRPGWQSLPGCESSCSRLGEQTPSHLSSVKVPPPPAISGPASASLFQCPPGWLQ